MMSIDKVRHRANELEEAARKRTATTVDSITAKLAKAYEVAKSQADGKGASAMTGAALGEAKLHGLLIEKRELLVTTADMTDAQIEAELAAIREEHIVTPSVTPGPKSKLISSIEPSC